MADCYVYDEITHDLSVLFSSDQRDFLIRNNGDQVKISSLVGKIVGIYIHSSFRDYYGHCTSRLVEIYEELAVSKGDFEVVFVSLDDDENSFNSFFAKMPWLAIPFVETNDIIKRLSETLRVWAPLLIIDSDGKIATADWITLVLERFGVDAYPFSCERINFLKQEVEIAKRNQSLSSLLVSRSRDFLLSCHGNYQVPVSELVGKTVGLYCSDTGTDSPRQETNTLLVWVYNKLKEKGEKFEVVYMSRDEQIKDFEQGLESMPWLALPYNDHIIRKLSHYFDIRKEFAAKLVIIGPDGNTLTCDAVDLVEEHGIDAYPFTLEKLDELEKAKQEPRTWDSLLGFADQDYVLGKNGSKVAVSELVGKNIHLYFSNERRPCLTNTLIKVYEDIKAKDEAFEVIFIGLDLEDRSAFNECISGTPWLALPFGDVRKIHLTRVFAVDVVPTIVAIGSSYGQTNKKVVDREIQSIILHGAEAYPFTEERFEYLEERAQEMAKRWPKKLKHDEHELVLSDYRYFYECNACMEMGGSWCFLCEKKKCNFFLHSCNFFLHPKCALDKE